MLFSPSHEWIHVEGDVATVGISAFGKQELGDVVHVQLPKVGKVLQAGEELAILESTKAACDIYAPISGSVVAVNEKLSQSPDLLNASPEREGWICKLKVADPQDLKALLSREKYKELTS